MENTVISPLPQRSPATWPPEAFRIGPTILAALGLVACTWVAIQVGIASAYALGETKAMFTHPQLTLGTFASQVIVYALTVVYLLAVLPRIARRSLPELGLGRPLPRHLVYGLLGAVAMFLAVVTSALIQQKLLGTHTSQKVLQAFSNAHPGIVLDLFVAMAVVLAPLVEELIFRAFIFNALLRRTPFVIAMLGSGLLFGIAHREMSVLFPLTMGGMVLAAIYYYSGSLWSSMLAHGLFNAINLSGLALYHTLKH